MDFDLIWDTLLNRKNATVLKELNEVLILENSFSSKEYYLTHIYEDSQFEFQALDSEQTLCHIRILPLQSFDDVKVAYKNFSMLREHTAELHLSPIKDIFEIFDGQWVFVIVCESLECITLGEINEYQDDFELPKEIGLMGYMRIIEIIQKSYKTGLMLNISPETVMLVKQDTMDNYIYTSQHGFYHLKLLASSQVSMYNKSKYENLFFSKRNTLDSEVWGAALWLFFFFSNKRLDSLAVLKTLENDEDRVKTVTTADPAVNSVLKSSIKSGKASNIFSDTNLKLWSLFLHGTWEELYDFPIKDISPLLTIIKFEISSSVLAAAKKILMVTTEHPLEVSKTLATNETLLEFLRVIRQYFDFYKYPLLINSVFLILKDKSFSTKMKTSLISSGVLYFYKKDILDNARNDFVCTFSEEFMENNTLTVLQLLWDNGFIDELCRKSGRSDAEVKFLKSSISFYGHHSLANVQKVSELLEINTLRTLQQYYEIPLVFKSNRLPLLLAYINNLLKRGLKLKEDTSEVIKTLIFILSESFLLPSFLQNQHIEGKCSNLAPNKFLEIFAKNPLIVKCAVCKYTCCLMCAEQFHKGHDLSFVLNSVFRCSEYQKIENPIGLPLKLPSYEQRFEMVETCKEYEGKSFVSAKEIGENEGYFEVFVAKAGFFESFYFGVWGTGVVYWGASGNIYRNGHLVATGPRIGSYDTVGAGVCGKFAFFTYNGLLVRPFVSCRLSTHPKVYFGFWDEGAQVEVKHNGWIFMAQSGVQVVNSQDCEEILMFILKKLKNLLTKRDQKVEDLRSKFLELAFGLKKDGFYEKVLKVIGRF